MRRPLSYAMLLLGTGGLVVAALHRYEPAGIDFHTYLGAARVGLAHGWGHLYDQDLVLAAQRALVPGQQAQPFLSPPPDAWLAALFAALPYDLAYGLWATLTFGALAAALLWASPSRGLARWVGVAGALAAWWVMHAVHLGQVVPLVAAAVAVAWRLLRERRDVVAGVVLAAVLLKPNTAFLVPLALLASGRWRAVAGFVAAAAVVAAAAALSLGAGGMGAYFAQLVGPLPAGADALTVHGATGIAGAAAVVVRAVVVAAALAGAYRGRGSPGTVLGLGAVASLLVAPYLHGSDLCLLTVAAWIAWEEHPAARWRIPLAAGWVLASPLADITQAGPTLHQWPFLELALLLGLLTVALRVRQGAPGRVSPGRALPA